MVKVQHLASTGGTKRSKFSLPDNFDGSVSTGAMYHAVRAFMSNQRQGTHSTKTRGEVSGGNQKPWKQKGTGRARQGTRNAAQWRGGGVVFGPRPRHHHIDLPKKVRQRARQSALNARVNEQALWVIESFGLKEPKTRALVEVLEKAGVAERKVLVLTASEARGPVFLSGRNLPNVHVMPYREATAYEILWSDVVLVEEAALAGGSAATDESEAADA